MKLSLIRLAAATLLCLFAGAVAAKADNLTATYYTIDANDPDANHLAGGTFTNEVQDHLGANGLPILNTTAFGCLINCYNPVGAPTQTVSATDGQITYWSPSLNSFVHQTSSGPTSLPFSDTSLFAPNGTGTCDGGSPCASFQALTLTGTISAPTTEILTFTIKSDDMAFVYIDGQLACSDGGIHAADSVTCFTPTVTAGDHQFALFFVDLNTVASELDFTINTTGVTTQASGVPEPSTLVLLGTGLVGAAGAVRRRLSR